MAIGEMLGTGGTKTRWPGEPARLMRLQRAGVGNVVAAEHSKSRLLGLTCRRRGNGMKRQLEQVTSVFDMSK